MFGLDFRWVDSLMRQRLLLLNIFQGKKTGLFRYRRANGAKSPKNLSSSLLLDGSCRRGSYLTVPVTLAITSKITLFVEVTTMADVFKNDHGGRFI